MRVHLPNGAQADKIRIDGEYVIVGSSNNVYIYKIGKTSIDLLGVLTSFHGDGVNHVQVIDNQYLSVFHEGTWTMRDCVDGLPVNHTVNVMGKEPIRITEVQDKYREDAYIVGVGCPLANPSGIETFVYLLETKELVGRYLCDNGTFVSFDDKGSVFYLDKDQGMLMLWQFGRAPMPIDVQKMLLKSSDSTADGERYTVRQHQQRARFITLEGYRGAVEINTFTRVCKVVWEHTYVYEIITGDRIKDCIVYDGSVGRYYVDDIDISDAVSNTIASAYKGNGKYMVNYAIDYPEHIALTCDDGAVHILRVLKR